jgi:hypothetical protein
LIVLVIRLAVEVSIELDLDQTAFAIRLPTFDGTVVVVVVAHARQHTVLVAFPGIDLTTMMPVALELPHVWSVAIHPGIDTSIEVGIDLFARELAACVVRLLIDTTVEVEVVLLLLELTFFEHAGDIDAAVEVDVHLGANLFVVDVDVTRVRVAVALGVYHGLSLAIALEAPERLDRMRHVLVGDPAVLHFRRVAAAAEHAADAEKITAEYHWRISTEARHSEQPSSGFRTCAHEPCESTWRQPRTASSV